MGANITLALRHLDRRPCNFRAAAKPRAKMTPVLAGRIRAWAASHPAWDNQRIAERYNVTNARVSEILNGKNK